LANPLIAKHLPDTGNRMRIGFVPLFCRVRQELFLPGGRWFMGGKQLCLSPARLALFQEGD